MPYPRSKMVTKEFPDNLGSWILGIEFQSFSIPGCGYPRFAGKGFMTAMYLGPPKFNAGKGGFIDVHPWVFH